MYSRHGILSIDKEKIVLNLKDIDGNTIVLKDIKKGSLDPLFFYFAALRF